MTPATNPLEGKPKATFPRTLIICLGTAVILATIFFAAKPAWRKFKSWRSRSLAAQAEQLIRRDDWKNAGEKARAAVLLAQTEPPALRAMARVLTHSTNAVALQFWQQLILDGHATETDRRAFVEIAIQTGALKAAAAELQKLLAESPDQPGNVWLASQLFAALGDRSQALHYATRAQLLDPQNEQYQLFLSSLLFDTPEADKRSEARSNIWSIARSQSRLGLEALQFLARRQDLTAGQNRELGDLLGRHPLSGLSEQLLALELELQREPSRRAEILDAAAARYATAGPVTRNQFAVWLNQHGEFERTLAFLPLDQARKHRDLFLPHADALAALGRWEPLRKILASNQAPLEPVYSEAFQARCATQLETPAAAAVHWSSAVRNAERNLEQLQWVAAYAEKCGEPQTAREALRSLIRSVKDPRSVYLALARLVERTGSTVELRDLFAEMLKFWPDDSALRNNHAYLNLLLSQETSESRETAEKLVNQFPENLAFRTTLALAWLRLKDSAAALRVYEGQHFAWAQSQPGQRAVYAAVLFASGKQTEARELAVRIPNDNLRAEERELVQAIQ
jgi:Tfp pilus assembly protein PilF